ncbi:YybH family protein [Actinomadura rugatobispora]|uniref:YybH family protein n=1 Tax=Actinomadura rugatobispora TaxID=1994 RepID=A0ABW0ZVQ5_9ACTN|nr:hypothetical protein GCM10010200_040320 [Actinomadura rugatobispora]
MDENAIRALMARHTDLWIRHEMDEWGALFTEDSDFITHRGLWWRTRAENVAGHKDVPPSVLDQKKNYTQDVVDIQEVTADVALVHTVWTWPDHRLPGAPAEDRRGLITFVLVRTPDGWRIRAAHNTRENGLTDFTATAT